MDITKQTKLINNNTGEVIFDEEENMEFFLFTDKGYLLHNNRTFTKVLHYLEWPIDKNDRAKLYELSPYINRQNALMRKDRPNHPLTVPLIAPIIELSLNRTYQWMKRLTDAGMIRKDDGFFYVNPLFIIASNRLSPQLYQIFQDQLDAHLPDWAKERYKELI